MCVHYSSCTQTGSSHREPESVPDSLSEKRAIRERREARLMFSQWAQRPDGISTGRKRTRCGRHRHPGETCMNCNNGVAFATTPALLDWLSIAAWLEEKMNQPSRSRSLGPAARPVNSEQASGISGGEVVVAEGEEIWGSYGETAAYIARWLCPFWRALAGFVAIVCAAPLPTHWFVVYALHEPIVMQFHCVIE